MSLAYGTSKIQQSRLTTDFYRTHKNTMKIGFISKGFPAVCYWVITVLSDISNPLHFVWIVPPIPSNCNEKQNNHQPST